MVGEVIENPFCFLKKNSWNFNAECVLYGVFIRLFFPPNWTFDY